MDTIFHRFLSFISISLVFNPLQLSLHAHELESQSQSQQDSSHYFIEIRAYNQAERSAIANFIPIDHITQNSVFSIVNEFDYQELSSHFSESIIHISPLGNLSEEIDINNSEIEFPAGDEKYHTFKEVVEKLNQFHENYPLITKLISLGKTREGQDILGINITKQLSNVSNTKKNEEKLPGILFVGSHHAREHLSTEVPMGLIDHLLKNYNIDTKITHLVNSRDITIVPLLNVDGASHDIVGRKYKMWRKNRTNNGDGSFGIDLNRNYSYGWGTGGSSRSTRSDVYMGPTPFSEPETVAIKNFISANANVKIILSFHTFSELILYPWGGKNDPVPAKDGEVFRKMSQEMAKWNNYKPQQSSELYIASGDTCDWAYGEFKIFCFTFELSPKDMWGGGFYPGAAVIEKVTNVNIPPSIYLIEHAENPYKVLEK